jgi:hypothetical protein
MFSHVFSLIKLIFLEPPKIDPDPEAKMGSPFPNWYNVLRAKYEKHLIDHKIVDITMPIKFTLGRFAVFLTNCYEGIISCTPAEQNCLNEVGSVLSWNSCFFTFLCFTYSFFGVFSTNFQILEASQDNTSLFHTDAPVFTIQDKDQKVRYITHYMSHRLYNFMRSVPELKYETKDEDSLKKMKFHD